MNEAVTFAIRVAAEALVVIYRFADEKDDRRAARLWAIRQDLLNLVAEDDEN